MKCVVTGSSGFVGKNLLPYLKDYKFKTLNRVDLENSSTVDLNGYDAVLHLAGKAHDLKKTSNPKLYKEVNYELTKELYDQFLASDAKKFIFISSVKAAADTVEGILTEEFVPDPQTPYGKSKLMAEQYIQNQPLPVGKSYYILRPCMIHGPGNKGNLNLLFKFISYGLPYPLAAFENKRSFLSVENLCFVIKALIEKSISSGIYNVADDKALSTNLVVQLLSTEIGKKPRLLIVPQSLMRAFAKAGDFLKLPFNTEKLNKLTENYVVDNSKIKAALKVQLPVDARNGLLKTAGSFKTT